MNTEKVISIVVGLGIVIVIGFLVNKWYLAVPEVQLEEPITVDDTEILKDSVAVLETNQGVIKLKLFREDAPETVSNFTKLISEGFYDGTRFHRVIKDFMIQAGDPLSRDLEARDRWGTGGPGYSFADEINQYKLVKGRLAMANPGRPDTNGSQFFIVTAESTPWLDGKHTVFGEVIEGMEVVEIIEAVQTGSDRPVKDQVIVKVYLE